MLSPAKREELQRELHEQRLVVLKQMLKNAGKEA